jgi:hypothetical protein
MNSLDLQGLYDSYKKVYETNDVIVDYLIAEGFADSEEGALAIKEHMSVEWLDEIIEAFKDLTPEQEEKVRKAKEKLAKRAADHNHEKWKHRETFNKLNNGTRKRFDPKLKEPREKACEHENQVKKNLKLVQNAQDALSRTRASRKARAFYNGEQTRYSLR